jgi:enoyl-CoA hydratase
MNDILIEHDGDVTIVTLNRPERHNAVDGAMAAELADALRAFDASDSKVAVLAANGPSFCADANLKAVATPEANRLSASGDGPMGVTRLALRKPVIAAIHGHAVAGGMAIALWCDLRVVEETATFGIFCRRWGVPLIDGGSVRLPRLIGHGRALDLILTGRAVDAREALAIGLASRVVPAGSARAAAVALAQQIARWPQECLRNDRQSARDQWGASSEAAALQREFELGLDSLRSDGVAGAARFAAGAGRHGSFDDL